MMLLAIAHEHHSVLPPALACASRTRPVAAADHRQCDCQGCQVGASSTRAIATRFQGGRILHTVRGNTALL